uniref:Glutamate decarboxylase 1 n=1 Tax=Macrostomum lignano TaxID=282301 RepID=A0A1I8JQE9_9PLAT
MEEVTLQKMREHIGWESGDGILAPGGSISNLYAAMVARYNRFPEVKMRGMRAVPELAMFTSKDAHYSVKKSAAILGMGMDSVYLVDTDNRGKMLPEHLEQLIGLARSRGQEPFFVSATGGTTVLGAFDRWTRSRTCASGTGSGSTWTRPGRGGVLLSQRHRHLLAGVQRADSVTWNPHKLMGVTLQCSVILLPERHIGLLQGCNGMQADYLFQQDKQYDVSYDTGDKSIQCGRRNDIFKLWLSWRAKGDEGYGEQVDYLIDLANYLCQQLKKRPGYEMVMEKPDFVNVCFWYVPEKFRSMKPGPERDSVINELVKRDFPCGRWPQSEGADDGEWHHNGGLPTPRQPAELLPHDRVSNPAATEADIDFLLDCIEKYSAEIFDDQPDEAGLGGGGGPAQ